MPPEEGTVSLCKRLQRHNRRTGGGAAKGIRGEWYRRRCVLRHPHRTPWVPNGTGQRCVGRYIVPEPYSLGCWQKWVVGESEEAGRRTLSSYGPENPEEKEIALSLSKWIPDQNKMKHRILLPALHRGKKRRCSRRLLRKSKLQHLRVARVRAASSTSCTTWGLAGTRGVSIQPGAEQLWRTQEGDGQTEAWPWGQWWMVRHAGAGCAGSPWSAAVPSRTAGQSPLRCHQTPPPGRWGHRESVPCPSSLPG